jgi:uncharacterized protein DUF3616
MRTIALALVAIAAVLTPSVAAANAKFGAVQTHNGTCEPSAAIAVPDGSLDTFIIASDEDNTLRAYRSTGGEPIDVAGGNLNEFLGLDPDKDDDDKADFEGATWFDGKVYWIGSHSRSGKGKLREQRWQFFATDVSGSASAPAVKPTAKRPFRDLLPAIAALDHRLKDQIKHKDEEEKHLAPDKGGFNIEGLTARADGEALLIALRSPLINGEAVLIPLENPKGVVESNKAPKLGDPINLNLGGRGIRSIEYSAAANGYFIVAGPSGDANVTFELFRWPAGERGPAVPIPGFAAALEKLNRSDPERPFQPEALVVDAAGKKLQLFSDDGDACKKLKLSPQFRSVTVTLE